MKRFFLTYATALFAALALGAEEPVDLVSAKGTKATAWVSLDAPAAGTFSVTAKLDGFEPVVSVVTKEPRDPNAFFTDLPGIGEKVSVGVGLADGVKGTPAQAGEKMTVRIVIEVGEKAAAGIVKGEMKVKSKSEKGESAEVSIPLCLRVLDWTLPEAKSRYSGRPWIAMCDGSGQQAYDNKDGMRMLGEWTVETTETYAKNSAAVKSVVGSLWKTKGDLQSERWRGLGVPYYALLDIPYVVNPDAWRRAAGAKAWLLGFDGVALPPERKVDPVVTAGLEDAEIDVRYLSYASELANGLADKSRNPVKVTYEGRLGQFWVDRVKVAEDDMDVVRLEAQARIVRLLAFAKKGVAK